MKLVMQTLNCWRNHIKIVWDILLLNVMVCDVKDDVIRTINHGFYRKFIKLKFLEALLKVDIVKLVVQTLNCWRKHIKIVWDILLLNIMVCDVTDDVIRAINH